MKKLPITLALVFSLSLAFISHAAPLPANDNAQTVIALSENSKTPPTAASVNSGKTLILVGTATHVPPGTKLSCCVDQLGQVRVPLKSFAELKAYDLTKDGFIDLNEAGYTGLFFARILPNGNFITIPLKKEGIDAIHYNKDGSSAIAEYDGDKIAPLVIVTLPTN